jgi:hypothetical protein
LQLLLPSSAPFWREASDSCKERDRHYCVKKDNDNITHSGLEGAGSTGGAAAAGADVGAGAPSERGANVFCVDLRAMATGGVSSRESLSESLSPPSTVRKSKAVLDATENGLGRFIL